MIFEVADIAIKDGTAAEFEAAVGEAVKLFRRASGCNSMKLQRSIENQNRYLLIVGWESVAHHEDLFRSSEDFQKWRALVGHYFASPSRVRRDR